MKAKTTKRERLSDLQNMIKNMHNQPKLSDSLPQGAKTVWAYGIDIAKLQIILPK